jgi:hypothetical protein
MHDIDLSARAVEARLREVSRLRDARRRRPDVDMLPRAVERRLRKVSELRDLCRRLAEFGPVARPQGD